MAKKGPITVCVINLKGGVGKSTITALLARHAFNSRGLDVLTIDLDPQANLSQGFLHEEYQNFIDEKRGSIVEVFNGYLPPNLASNTSQTLQADDVCETILAAGDRTLQLIPSRFDFSENLTTAVRPEPKKLAKFLSKNFKEKDIVFIDCSPTESVFTTAAYHASSHILIPVKPEYFATIGFPLLSKSLDGFRSANMAHQIDVAGVVINNPFYDGGNNGGPEKTRAISEINKEAKRHNWHIFKREIPHSRGFPKIMRGDYKHSGNAERFWYFAQEFYDKLGL